MKEMTIEQKAEAYEKALERAKRMFSEKELNYLFPEFKESKESEDERIRKALIDGFTVMKESKNCGKTFSNHNIPVADIIAWLEKQGEQKVSFDDFKAKDWYVSKVDGKIRNIYHSVDKIEPKFNVGDKVYNIKNRFECTIESIDDTTYYCDTTNFDIKDQNNWELVEPKFHEGEWITNGDYTWKIVEVKHLDYILQSQDGSIVDDTISHVDEQFHSFTIEDAKPGDVIYLPNSNNEYYFFIFKGIENAAVMSFAHFYQYDDGTSEVKGTIDNLSSVNDVFQPATKEQRDLLFAKMKEAGYEWNAGKKELKKIEQKSAWSEEDERKISLLEALCDVQINSSTSHSTMYSEMHELKDWLKSLKDRVQPKQEWSEEDADAIGMAIIALEDIYDPDEPNDTYIGYSMPVNKAAARLRYLKDRVLPQPKQ